MSGKIQKVKDKLNTAIEQLCKASLASLLRRILVGTWENIKKKKKNCNKLHILVAQGKDKGLLLCFICIILNARCPKANSESNQGLPAASFPLEKNTHSYTASNLYKPHPWGQLAH